MKYLFLRIVCLFGLEKNSKKRSLEIPHYRSKISGINLLLPTKKVRGYFEVLKSFSAETLFPKYTFSNILIRSDYPKGELHSGANDSVLWGQQNPMNRERLSLKFTKEGFLGEKLVLSR